MDTIICRCCSELIEHVPFTVANTKVCTECAGDHDNRHPDGWRDQATAPI